MTCPVCQNTAAAKTCTHCKGWGQVTLEGCPKKVVSLDVWRSLDAFDLMDKHGVLPCLGGSLDQCASFVAIIPTIRRLTNAYRPKSDG